MSSSKPFVYKSSNKRLYYLHGGENLPAGLNLYSFNEHSESALISMPSGYVIIERESSENIPALVSERHTREQYNCQWEKILDLVERCDTQFYLSNVGDPQWNEKRKSNIVKMIAEFEEIGKTITCSECQKEIEWQIELQSGGIGAT